MAESSVVASIRGKIEALIAENRKLREECGKSAGRRDKLAAENRELVQKLAQVEKRMAVLELKEGFGGSSDNTKRARARVNRLMREVDKCIAMMNREGEK